MCSFKLLCEACVMGQQVLDQCMHLMGMQLRLCLLLLPPRMIRIARPTWPYESCGFL